MPRVFHALLWLTLFISVFKIQIVDWNRLYP